MSGVSGRGSGRVNRQVPRTRSAALRGLQSRIRRQLPGLLTVYDNYNALVIEFGPSERASAALSRSRCIRVRELVFLQGAKLSDPHG